MGLTDEERRRLNGLAEVLSRDDPGLGRALSGDLPPRRRRRLSVASVTLGSLMISLPLLILGIAVAQTLVFAAGSIVMIVAAGSGLVGVQRSLRRRRDRRRMS
jgi:hypothetical protein